MTIKASYVYPTIAHRWEDDANVTLFGPNGRIGRAERKTRTSPMFVYAARSGVQGDETLIAVVDHFHEAEAAFERYIGGNA